MTKTSVQCDMCEGCLLYIKTIFLTTAKVKFIMTCDMILMVVQIWSDWAPPDLPKNKCCDGDKYRGYFIDKLW